MNRLWSSEPQWVSTRYLIKCLCDTDYFKSLWWYLVLFSCSVVSNSLQLHGLQHSRLPCTSPSPRVCPSPCPLNRWCHPTISSSVTSFSSCPQSLPASGSFPKSQLFASGGQGIRASASASVFLMNIQGRFPLRWTGLISLQSRELSKALSSLWSTSHNLYVTPGKTIALTVWTFVSKVMSLLFNTLSVFVITFLPKSNLLIFTGIFKLFTSFEFSYHFTYLPVKQDACIMLYKKNFIKVMLRNGWN